MHTCTNVHKCAQTVADIQRKHTDAKTQTHTAVPISFPISSLLQFAFIFLQLESGAAAPCTLLDTSNFLKQPTSFATHHASLNSYYTEDPCNFASWTSGVWSNIFSVAPGLQWWPSWWWWWSSWWWWWSRWWCSELRVWIVQVSQSAEEGSHDTGAGSNNNQQLDSNHLLLPARSWVLQALQSLFVFCLSRLPAIVQWKTITDKVLAKSRIPGHLMPHNGPIYWFRENHRRK